MDIEDQAARPALGPGVEEGFRRGIVLRHEAVGVEKASQALPDACIVINDGHNGWMAQHAAPFERPVDREIPHLSWLAVMWIKGGEEVSSVSAWGESVNRSGFENILNDRF